MAELEAHLARAPDDARVTLQLAQLQRLEGNAARSLELLRRYVALRPDDVYVSAQLRRLEGGPAGERARPGAEQAPPRLPPALAALQAAAEPAPESALQRFWQQGGRTLAMAALALLAAWFVITRVGRFISHSVEEQERSQESLRRGMRR